METLKAKLKQFEESLKFLRNAINHRSSIGLLMQSKKTGTNWRKYSSCHVELARTQNTHRRDS